MPYFITNKAHGCAGWATTKHNGTVITCHKTKQQAINHMVALSMAEKIQPGGELGKKKESVLEAFMREAGAEEWNGLNDRQQTQAKDTAELAVQFGKFDQTSKEDGAHYAPAAKNPFKATGLMCQNCVFFDETSNGCQVVQGTIESEAICKLWVIPSSLISE